MSKNIRFIKNKNMKWWVGIMSTILLFLVIGIFSYEKMVFIFRGVEIKASIEKKNDSSLATVSGNAAKAINLTLNGREIFIDKEGNFSESIAMLPGFSVVTINARDKFGKTAEQKFEIVTEESASSFAFKSGEIIN
jgi:hypothetical protein